MNDLLKHAASCLIIPLIFMCSESSANALHWLSQVEIEQENVANAQSSEPKLSVNGRYVTFQSSATNLIETDYNGSMDIFWHDLQTRQTKQVNTTQSGQQTTGAEDFSAPTSDGQYVAFMSAADNLPNGDLSGYQLYLKNLNTGEVTHQNNYGTDDNFSVFRNDRLFLSDDAQFITFVSNTNIAAEHTNVYEQIYRKNITTQTVELISKSVDNTGANDDVRLLDVSDNGRYILMSTESDNLTTDTINNTRYNIFLRDSQLNTTLLINTTPSGDSSVFDDYIFYGSVSNAGTVTYSSSQSDLVLNDVNDKDDIFYFDGSITSIINLNTNDQQITDHDSYEPIISGDGSRILFLSRTAEYPINNINGDTMIYSYGTSTGNLTVVTRVGNNELANNDSRAPTLSLDGNVMVFETNANNLPNAPINPQQTDLVAHQFNTGNFRTVTYPFSLPHTIFSDVNNAQMSSDQMSVVYQTKSSNITDGAPIHFNYLNLYLLDRNTNEHQLIANQTVFLDLSSSGRYITFASLYQPPLGIIHLGEINIFLYDRADSSFTLVNEGYYPKVNNEGKVIWRTDNDLVANDNNGDNDLYLFDPSDNSTTLISKDTAGNAATSGGIADIAGSGNNTRIVFDSSSDDIVTTDTNGEKDVFVYQPSTDVTFRASQTLAGVEGDNDSSNPQISENGRFISFYTRASNLAGNTNSENQIMLLDTDTSFLEIVSLNESDQANLIVSSEYSSISDSGRYVAFIYDDLGQTATSLPGDTDNNYDVVVRDRQTGTSQLISVGPYGNQVDDPVDEYLLQVTEDSSQSTPLLGVLFAASQPDGLTGIPNHPGHNELFLFQKGGDDVTLNVEVLGLGRVTGTSGIDCTDSCDYDFSLGSDLNLLVMPAPGYIFGGWQIEFGSCEADDSIPCDVIMDRTKTVSAYFTTNDLIFSDGFE